MQSPFTVTEQHPTGVTVVTAAILAPVIILVAHLLGLELTEAEAIGVATLLIAIPSVISSKRNPRITLPATPPETTDGRGITETPAVKNGNGDTPEWVKDNNPEAGGE